MSDRLRNAKLNQSISHRNITNLFSQFVETPLGLMMAIADNKALYLLEFRERKNLARNIEGFTHKINAHITQGYTSIIQLIQEELEQYFAGTLKTFKTPIFLGGSPFQKRVWSKLKDIPYGKTKDYSALAAAIDKPSACRAVANANGANQFAIIIPCHRVINKNGALGGYAGGIERKEWLLQHEKRTK